MNEHSGHDITQELRAREIKLSPTLFTHLRQTTQAIGRGTLAYISGLEQEDTLANLAATIEDALDTGSEQKASAHSYKFIQLGEMSLVLDALFAIGNYSPENARSADWLIENILTLIDMRDSHVADIGKKPADVSLRHLVNCHGKELIAVARKALELSLIKEPERSRCVADIDEREDEISRAGRHGR